jgi:hypothetical protein
MGRAKMNISDDDRKSRRAAQVKASKVKRAATDPEKVKARAKDQRWTYRQTHPASVERAVRKQRDKRKEIKLKNMKLDLKAQGRALKPYILKHLFRA